MNWQSNLSYSNLIFLLCMFWNPSLKGQETAETMYAQGRIQYDNGDFKAAWSFYDQALKLDSVYIPALFERAGLKAIFQDEIGAIYDYTVVLAINPELWEAHIERARAHFGLAEFSIAISDLTEVIEGGHDTWNMYDIRAYAGYLGKDFEAAILDYTAAIDKNPKNGSLYIERARCAKNIGDTAAVKADFEKAVSIDVDLDQKWTRMQLGL